MTLQTRRHLRRQPNDHNFGSLPMLAVAADAFLLVRLPQRDFDFPAGVARIEAIISC
jgi:hypothetical protein